MHLSIYIYAHTITDSINTYPPNTTLTRSAHGAMQLRADNQQSSSLSHRPRQKKGDQEGRRQQRGAKQHREGGCNNKKKKYIRNRRGIVEYIDAYQRSIFL